MAQHTPTTDPMDPADPADPGRTRDPDDDVDFALERDFDEEREGAGPGEGRRRVFDNALLRESVNGLPARRPIVLSGDASVTDAIRAMQREHRGAVVVTADGTPQTRLVGIFTERDVLLRVVDRGRNPATLRLAEVMTMGPECLPQESTIAWVLNKMCVGGFRHVPVVDQAGRPVFVVSVRDVVEFLVEAFPREVLNLPLDYGADRQRDREGA
jgi:CBS domain-containing protein